MGRKNITQVKKPTSKTPSLVNKTDRLENHKKVKMDVSMLRHEKSLKHQRHNKKAAGKRSGFRSFSWALATQCRYKTHLPWRVSRFCLSPPSAIMETPTEKAFGYMPTGNAEQLPFWFVKFTMMLCMETTATMGSKHDPDKPVTTKLQLTLELLNALVDQPLAEVTIPSAKKCCFPKSFGKIF
ncbi:hypothetical protein MG293_011449 [Ovis ammon polii]|uniref:Uncharacterized protein n=1 Tax=Ovis ammon polii TaxID=230172 RepID=A0AAD4Y980_OVIAM|nr:hypothetical protein MG293_011449 [Ovis ammon polii]KAI4562254.1 hypothetical protein MJT46_011216 [Ovis ammon polii x Ovis aries]